MRQTAAAETTATAAVSGSHPTLRSRWLEVNLPRVEEQLALAEAILEEAHEGRLAVPVARTWMASELTVVVGSSSRIDDEVDRLRRTPPAAAEVERAVNAIEAQFYRSMERVGSYRGKALQLNEYYNTVGDPDYFAKDLARYRAVTPAAVQAAIVKHLPKDRRVELVVTPEPGQ